MVDDEVFEDHRDGRVVIDRRVADPSELVDVRHRAAAACQGPVAELGDDLALCVSELVTNALLHGEGPVRVVVLCARASVTIAVRDRARRTPQLVLSSSHVGGRGLRIVDALSHRWGMEFGADGKTVWATLCA
jgi:anti-sigma regulatory factor (Ser/Thr protein kinase)